MILFNGAPRVVYLELLRPAIVSVPLESPEVCPSQD